MAPTVYVTQRSPSLLDTITVAGVPFSLANCSVTFNMRPINSAVLRITNGPVVIVNAAAGTVRYDWTTADTAAPGGEFIGWWSVLLSSGLTQDSPEFKIVMQTHAASPGLNATTGFTLADYQAIVQSLAQRNDPASAGRITQLLNEAYMDVCARTGCNMTSQSVTLTPYKNDYSIMTDWAIPGLLKIGSIRYKPLGGSQSFRLAPSTLDNVLEMQAAVAVGFLRLYARYGMDHIVLYPAPVQADVLTLYYAPTPPLLQAAGDVASGIPMQFQRRTLPEYAAAKLMEEEPESMYSTRWGGRYVPGLATTLMNNYEAAVTALQAWMTRSLSNTNIGIQAGYPDLMTRPQHDRSTYFSGWDGA